MMSERKYYSKNLGGGEKKVFSSERENGLKNRASHAALFKKKQPAHPLGNDKKTLSVVGSNA